MVYPALRLTHYRVFIEASIGPMRKVVEGVADAPDRLARVRADFEALVTPYYVDNQIQQSYLLTRAPVR
jgi:hypothetical protein